MHRTSTGRAGLLPLVTLLATAGLAEAQLSAVFTGEYDSDESALDIGSTTNGKWGVVRLQESDSPEITVWSLLTPSATPALAVQSFGGVTRSGSAANFPSDLVSVVNGRAVCVGSRANLTPYENETIVDILDLHGATPAILAQHLVPSGTGQNQESGHVNDVEITPSRRHAVVNHKNTVLMYDLATGAYDVPPIVLEPTSSQWRDPSGCVDSVVLTNDVAVVITGYTDASGQEETWVYMIEIPTGTISLRHQLVAWDDGDHRPHDLAMTPDESMVVVTASGAVGFFNVAGRSLEREVVQAGLVRQWGEMVDSVSCSDQAAAIIANDVSSGTAHWNVQIWDLDNGGGAVPFLVAEETDDGEAENRAHDVLVGPPLSNFSGTGPRAAGVRTESEVVVVQDVEGAATLTVLPVPSGSTPIVSAGAYSWASPFVSDSVEIGEGFIVDGPVEGGGGAHQYVVTHGTDFVPIIFRAYAQFVDVVGTPSMTELQVKRSDGQPASDETLSIDLFLTDTGDGVFLRSVRPSSTASIEPAVTLFSFDPVAIQTTLGASGVACWSMDSMLTTAHEALSVCETNSGGTVSHLHQASY